MDLKEMCINTRNWVDSAQDRNYRRAPVSGRGGSRADHPRTCDLGVDGRIILEWVHVKRL